MKANAIVLEATRVLLNLVILFDDLGGPTLALYAVDNRDRDSIRSRTNFE